MSSESPSNVLSRVEEKVERLLNRKKPKKEAEA